jgi:hypothetical protein
MGVSGRSESGFTLIEALLATTLMSLLMLTATYVYNYISQNWDRQRHQYNRQLEQHIDVTLVSRVLRNSYAKVVYPTDPLSAVRPEVPGYYFLGRQDGFTAVSASSVQNLNHPAVYRVFREPVPGNTELWQLVYEEAPLVAVPLYHAGQELNFNFRRVLLTDLTELKFAYQGFVSIQERTDKVEEAGSPDGQPLWHDEYDGMNTKQHPVQINIVINNFVWPVRVGDNFNLTYGQTNSDV